MKRNHWFYYAMLLKNIFFRHFRSFHSLYIYFEQQKEQKLRAFLKIAPYTCHARGGTFKSCTYITYNIDYTCHGSLKKIFYCVISYWLYLFSLFASQSQKYSFR